MHPRPLSLAALAACCALAATVPSTAQTFKDPALEALFVADQSDALRRLSAQRTAARPDDAQAVLGLALTALERDDAGARREAIASAQACLERQPRAAPCHYALGVVLGVQALSEGLFKAARSAGTVRDALAAAVDIEPGWYRARSALTEFYLLAPGVMGGSAAKAGEVARAAQRPEQVRLLKARIALDDKKFEVALQTLAPLLGAAPPLSADLVDDLQNWGTQACIGLINAGQPATAQPFLERLVRERPDQALAVYGLGRARADSGAPAEALKLYEQAARLKGAAVLPIDYRVGLAQQQLGRNDDARAAFARFVASGKGQKTALEDARKRLEQLGG